MPSVSILMAHSGPPTYIDAACRAINAQEYSDVELIVVDDGAGLDWKPFLGRLRCPWRVLANPTRLGLARSMNRAAQAAEGSLLARMDSDDVIVPWRLKSQVAHLTAHPEVGFLGSAVYWLDEGGRCLGRSYPLTEPDDLSVGLSTYNQMSHGSMLIRREAFESVGGYDESLNVAQDYDLWVRAVQAGHALANLPEPLYGQRLHTSSTSSRAANAQLDVAGRLWKREPSSARSARVAAWFDAGRDGLLGRPYESLQLGRLGLLLFVAAASRRIGAPCRGSVARFAARHAPDAVELLVREVGWRRQTLTKVRKVLSRA
jgi:GT2 family glycosyltransferase